MFYLVLLKRYYYLNWKSRLDGMFCKRCGKENIEDAKFCSKCGSDIEKKDKNIARRCLRWFKDNKIFVGSASLVFVFYFIFLMFFFQVSPTYDYYRDLTIVKEIYHRGTFSYYGQAYVINPPMNYLIESVPLFIFGGLIYTANKILEICIFFSALVILYFISLRILKDKTKALLSFMIASLTWTFIYATPTRSHSIVFLISCAMVLAYLRYQDDNNYINACILGLIMGLSMLIKSSLVFLIFLISLHFFYYCIVEKKIKGSVKYYSVFAIVALAVYIPYLIYIYINQLPWPWVANMINISGGAAWLEGYVAPPFYFLYYVVLKHWNVLFIISIISFFWGYHKKVLNKDYFLLYLILFLGPLIAKLVIPIVEISSGNLHHWYYFFIPLPILTVFFIYEFRENVRYYLLVFVFIALLVNFFIFIPREGISIEKWSSNKIFNDIKDMKGNETVLSNWERYNYINAMSNSYSEFSQGVDLKQALIYDADYYFLTSKSDEDWLYLVDEGKGYEGSQIYVYKINKAELMNRSGLIKKGVIRLVNSHSSPVSMARCAIYDGSGFSMMKVSDNAGEIELTVPNSGEKGTYYIECIAMGYDKYSGEINSSEISLGKLHPFYHKYTGTRY